jgi:hypothetical protein
MARCQQRVGYLHVKDRYVWVSRLAVALLL